MNLKTTVTRRQSTLNFSKNEHFLTPDTHTYVCASGGKKCSFFGKFGVLCFLVTSVLRFALLPYYRGYNVWWKIIFIVGLLYFLEDDVFFYQGLDCALFKIFSRTFMLVRNRYTNVGWQSNTIHMESSSFHHVWHFLVIFVALLLTGTNERNSKQKTNEHTKKKHTHTHTHTHTKSK